MKTVKIRDIKPNSWDNVYWFSRMLINSDRYGGIGSETKTMHLIGQAIHSLRILKEPEETKLEALKRVLEETLFKQRRPGTAKYQMITNLYTDLVKRLITVKDYEVLELTCKQIMIPINFSIGQIPNSDNEFAESVVKALLDTKGIRGLATVINLWDDIGSEGCMNAERMQVVQAFGKLRTEISKMMTSHESDTVLTAFCQEFERRIGQKRKGRAGRGVESVTSFILDYFKVKATHAPEHFTTGLEVDKWIRCKDGWLIGISCKRTLRERWKQAYTTDTDLLNRHKIKQLWHVITFDRDLSDEKITEIGSHRAILYLPDDSQRLKTALSHEGMKAYVRPLTAFIKDLKKI